MAAPNRDASTSNSKKDASTNMKQEYGDSPKPMNSQMSDDNNIRNKEIKTDISAEEDPDEDPLAKTEQKLELLYTDYGYGSADFNNIEAWLEDDPTRESSLNRIQSLYSEIDQEIRDKLSRNIYNSVEADSLLQLNDEKMASMKRQQEDDLRRYECFWARMAKLKYLRAVKLCEDGLYESAAAVAEEARERRPGNEMVRELRRKITMLRIGVLEGEIEVLREAWWKDRE